MSPEKEVDEDWKNKAAEDHKLSRETGEKKIFIGPDFNKDGENSSKTADEESQSGENLSENNGQASDPGSSGAPDVTFLNYITSLGFQAMIFLGDIDNPVTQKKEENLEQARFLIDTMNMLRDKTKSNLTPQEENLLNASIYELQMRFVEKKGKSSGGQ